MSDQKLSEDLKHGYFENPLKVPSLSYVSNSKIQTILESPAKFREQYTRGIRPKESAAMELGKRIHWAVLQPDVYEKMMFIVDYGSATGPDKAKITKQANIDRGERELISKEDHEEIMAIKDSVYENEYAALLLHNSFKERFGYAQDPETELWMHSRPDVNTIYKDKNWILDLKTTSSIQTDEFKKNIFTMGYFTQIAFYLMVNEIITGRKDGGGGIIAVETSPPYECRIFPLDEVFEKMGRIKVNKGLNLIKKFLIDDPEMKNKKLWRLDPLETIKPEYWMLSKDVDFSELIQIGG